MPILSRHYSPSVKLSEAGSNLPSAQIGKESYIDFTLEKCLFRQQKLYHSGFLILKRKSGQWKMENGKWKIKQWTIKFVLWLSIIHFPLSIFH
jgi:hypothetical protein